MQLFNIAYEKSMLKEWFIQDIRSNQKFRIFHMKVLKGHILLRLTVESINMIKILLE